MKKTFLLFILAFGMTILGWGQLYWNGSGTWNASTGSRWGTSIGGPYTTTWTTGSAAVFAVTNSIITGATTAFSSITANENVTVTAGGTLGTGGTVAIITIASGKTFNFTNQTISAAIGTGFIKAGAGEFAMSGSLYNGGFTLNAGTFIVRGINSVGTGMLTINGGIFAANATCDLSGKPSIIVIGGDFTFGATTGLALSAANLTFNAATYLGNNTSRTITLGGTGTYSLNGIISGTSSSLTINATAAGFLSLGGANTYNGGTTITGGILVLGASGVLADAGTITLNGGTLKTGATTGFSETAGTLNLNNNSTIALGTGSHFLNFAASDDITWNGTTLTITGWVGTAGSTGTAGKIFVGSDATGLTSQQLAKISFTGYTTGAQILSTGEIVPPEAPAATYSWQGTDNASWAVAANWNPTRTTPATNDVLQFNDGTTKTITTVPTQTIGQMSVSNNTAITLQAAAGVTLTIAGGSGDDLTVGAGSHLNLGGSSAIVIALPTGVIGIISGLMIFSGSSLVAHRLTGTDNGSIIFANGSIFTAGTNLSGSPFGTTALNSIVFQSGSTYVHAGGTNPFGAGAPSTVVSFQSGSLYKTTANFTLSFSGRTFSNYELDFPTGSISVSGGSAVVMDNLTITNGTLNFNMTGTPGHSIKGNITVASGATLNFNPATAGTVSLNGSALQTISGTGTISNGPALFSTIAIANSAGVTLNTSATLYNLTIGSGSNFTINAGKALTVNGATITNGGLILKSPAGTGPTGSFLPTGTVTGSVTVERYIPQYTSNADGWYFLSSPVSGQAISPNFAPGTNDDVYRWNESVTDHPWINYKGSSPFSTFNSGEGYLVAYQASGTKTFAGSLNQSNITVSTQSYTVASTWSGWHLLGNPYSCAVQWNKTGGSWGLSNVEAVAQIMNSGGTYTSRSANDLIPAMNGFMVHVASGTNSLTIPLAARTHSGIDWMKSTANIQDKLMLTAASTENTTYVETIVQFNQEATPAFDMAYDGHFLSGIAAAPQLYSIVGDEHLCVNTLPQTDNTRTVHLGFVKGSSVNYTMNVTGLESFNPDVSVFLEDTKASKTQDLRQSSAYSFSAADGDNANRFLLHFGGLFGVNDLSKDDAIQIYAYNNTIYVANNGGQPVTGHVFVYNLMGQQMMQQELGGNKLTTLNLSGSTGYYLVKVITSGNSYSGKVFLR
jgi:autotransporter-associated beta strand protein